jgi:hypothetical protein
LTPPKDTDRFTAMPKTFNPQALAAYREVREVLQKHGFYIEGYDESPDLAPVNGSWGDAEDIAEMEAVIAKEERRAEKAAKLVAK